MLIPIENVFSKEEAASFKARLLAEPWQDGRATAGSLAVHVKSNLQLADDNPVGMAIGQHILSRLGEMPAFISAALPKKIYPPKFNCYRENGAYGLHVDSAIMNLPQGLRLRTDLSMTLFLNEPEEYEGGELCIDTLFGVQEVKLPAGSMVLYPSESLHEVSPVTAGQRLCSFFWLESMVRNAQRRAQLFDLDSSIQSLTRELGAAHPEVRNLNGLYHNLVRSWADT